MARASQPVSTLSSLDRQDPKINMTTSNSQLQIDHLTFRSELPIRTDLFAKEVNRDKGTTHKEKAD